MNHFQLEKSLFAMDSKFRNVEKHAFIISHPIIYFQSISETLPKRMQV